MDCALKKNDAAKLIHSRATPDQVEKYGKWKKKTASPQPTEEVAFYICFGEKSLVDPCVCPVISYLKFEIMRSLMSDNFLC
jgi:hypothetical protein